MTLRLLPALLLLSARAGLAAPCPPAAELSGAPDLVVGIGVLLAGRGVGAAAPARCPAVRAALLRQDGAVVVTITEGPDRRTVRQLPDSEMAATYIESWARRDISAPLLLGRPDPPAPPPPPAPIVSIAPVRTRFSLALLGEVGFGINRTIWAGAALWGCLRVGPVCPGLLLRIAPAAFREANPGAMGRLDTSLLLGLELPLRRGRLSLHPGIGLGVGWQRVALDPRLPVAGSLDFGGLRAALRLGGAVEVFRGLAIEASLGLEAAFGGTSEARLIFPPPPLAPPMAMGEPVTIAGPPWGLLRAGLGLRWSSGP